MPTIGKPKPRFLKFVSKPAGVGNIELSKAEPVYIAGLPTPEAPKIADIAGLQAILTDYEDRFDTLEISDIAGLQAILTDLEDRIAALEPTEPDEPDEPDEPTEP